MPGRRRRHRQQSTRHAADLNEGLESVEGRRSLLFPEHTLVGIDRPIDVVEGRLRKLRLTQQQIERLEEGHDLDFSYVGEEGGRFRVNVFQQRGTLGIVFRVIPFGVKTAEQLHLPKIVEKISHENRGLVLVTGTTGSGKSVGVNAMLLSILYKSGPDKVRLIMVDPKMLELSVYEGIPHLLAPVVTDMKEAANALRWCVAEMETRYELMAALGVRNISGYNRKVKEAIDAGDPIKDPIFRPPEIFRRASTFL